MPFCTELDKHRNGVWQMIKKCILLWGILVVLTCLYSLPDRQVWTLEGKYLSLISQTRWTANYRFKRADQIMDTEKVRAGQRRDAGIWGTTETGIVWSEYMPCEDPAGGLNLPWGAYEVTVTAKAGAALAGGMVSAECQSFIEDGDFAGVTDEHGEIRQRFTLTDTTFGLFVAFDQGRSAVRSITVRRLHGFLSMDAAAVFFLIGIIGTVLLRIFEIRGVAGMRARRDALAVLCIAGFASMPLLWSGLYAGHDLLFHLNRIEGIAAGLRCGQFPVRIHASTLLGYGYAASEFYPELFLYLPAIMRNMGVSLSVCAQLFLGLVNLLTAVFAYFAGRRLTRDRGLAAGFALLYTVNPYRLVNLYTRATFGESLAMVFFPVLIVAMVELLTGDDRKWPLLTAAMLGIFMSHLLSTLFSAFFCALAVILCLPRLIREKRRILSGLLAAALTVLSGLWFIVPMLDYSRDGISTYVGFDSWLHALDLGGLLVGFAGGTGASEQVLEDFSYSIGVVPGFALMLGGALAFMRLTAAGLKEKTESDSGSSRRFMGIMLFFGCIALFFATKLFPWEKLCRARQTALLFSQIQFPWRFVGVASPFLALAGAWGYCMPRYRHVGMALMLVLSMISGGYVMQHVVEPGPVLGTDDVSHTRQDQFEYLYPYTEKEALETGCLQVRGLVPNTISDYRKHGTTLTFQLEIEPGNYLIEAPLLYYPGYEAVGPDGIRYSVDRGTNNVLRIAYPSTGEKTGIMIRYTEPLLWRVCEGMSLLSIICLLILMRRRCRWR